MYILGKSDFVKYLNYVLMVEAIYGVMRVRYAKKATGTAIRSQNRPRRRKRAIDDDRAVEGETMYRLA